MEPSEISISQELYNELLRKEAELRRSIDGMVMDGALPAECHSALKAEVTLDQYEGMFPEPISQALVHGTRAYGIQVRLEAEQVRRELARRGMK